MFPVANTALMILRTVEETRRALPLDYVAKLLGRPVAEVEQEAKSLAEQGAITYDGETLARKN